MGVELLEVRGSLAQYAPFDVLPPTVLAERPRQCTLRYARRGTVVLDVGAPGAGLYVVRSGAVDVVDQAGGLVERVGTGRVRDELAAGPPGHALSLHGHGGHPAARHAD